MGAFTDLNDYLGALSGPSQRPFQLHGSQGSINAGRPSSTWSVGITPQAGAVPSTAVTCSRATTGSIFQGLANSDGSGQLYLAGVDIGAAQPGVYLLCDRLSHQGGLSGTSATTQTTNLPTAALPRYTSGVGVMAGLEIYTVIGTTATSISASYTNQAGTSGQISRTIAWGGTGWREAGRLVLLPLANGDTGVRSVESVTATATTGTLGNFGVTLFKPLVMVMVNGFASGQVSVNVLDGGMAGGFPEILDDACLFWVRLQSNTVSTNGFFASLSLAER